MPIQPKTNQTFAKHLATFWHHSANFAAAKLKAGGLEAEARAPEEVDGPAELAPLEPVRLLRRDQALQARGVALAAEALGPRGAGPWEGARAENEACEVTFL